MVQSNWYQSFLWACWFFGKELAFFFEIPESNWYQIFISKNLWLIFMKMKRKTKSKWPTQKTSFSSSANSQNVFFVFLGCFWGYDGQPLNHIGWTTSFTLIILLINTWNYREKTCRIGGFENFRFFESAILQKKIK